MVFILILFLTAKAKLFLHIFLKFSHPYISLKKLNWTCALPQRLVLTVNVPFISGVCYGDTGSEVETEGSGMLHCRVGSLFPGHSSFHPGEPREGLPGLPAGWCPPAIRHLFFIHLFNRAHRCYILRWETDEEIRNLFLNTNFTYGLQFKRKVYCSLRFWRNRTIKWLNFRLQHLSPSLPILSLPLSFITAAQTWIPRPPWFV